MPSSTHTAFLRPVAPNDRPSPIGWFSNIEHHQLGTQQPQRSLPQQNGFALTGESSNRPASRPGGLTEIAAAQAGRMTVLSSRALPQLASVGTPVPADAFGYLRLPRAARDPRCLWTCKAQNPTKGGGRKKLLAIIYRLSSNYAMRHGKYSRCAPKTSVAEGISQEVRRPQVYARDLASTPTIPLKFLGVIFSPVEQGQ